MESTQRTQPNTLLRQQRLLRGWSLQHVVEQLCSLCQEEEDVPGVTADMVSKWERGERKPSRFYQTKLCLLYSTNADRLGFLEASDIREPVHAKEPRSSLVIPSFLPEPSTSTKAIDALLTQEKEGASETVAAHLLSLSGKQLAMLTTFGWTQEDIMKALQIVLQGETAMANMNRRQVLQLGASMLVFGGINFPTEEHPSTQKRTQLAQHIGESIVAGWTLFHTAGTAQVLAVSQSQLALIQQAHTTLHPDALPFLYSGAYRLMGAALYFQQRYKEAFYTHDCGYLAAIESRDTWNVAESLSWAAYVYQECNQHAKAIEAIQEALKVIENRQDEASLRLKAHLLACWAENATRLHEKRTASEKLESSEALLDQIAPNEEFDRTKWHQQAGNCAMINGDYATAARHFQEALDSLPHHWTLRHAITLVPLASAYAHIGERDKSLEVADKALPALTAMNATLMLQQFAEYIRHDLIEAYPGDPQVQAFVANTRQRLPQLSC
jgi:tetratricopeptide (TPR) repeat protein/transcriptional regulator with XRE-family HTH domain